MATLAHDRPVTSVAFGPRATLLTASSDGVARIWSLRGGRQIASFGEGTTPIRSAAFDATGARVITGGDDGTARVYEAETREPRAVLKHPGPVVSVRFSPDGK